jgi:dihydrolipoamide dehydrogenase
MSEKAEIVIIGAGTAGLSALREVRRHTQDVVLINDGHWGTTCAAVGCMPSKALIAAANAFHARETLTEFGISGAEDLAIDIPSVLERVRRLRDDFVKGPESVRETLGERAIAGRARLAGPQEVVVGDRRIRAGKIILAPGSTPVVPKPWQEFGDRILTSDTLFEQADLPRRIAVIGLGAIGVELAQALARLGIEVAGFDALETVAGISDPKVRDSAITALTEDFALHLGAPAELAAHGDAIRVEGAGGSFEADTVLAALGRRPQLDGLGLETLGVSLDDKGQPPADPNTMQIADLPVYLAGDANGARALLHEAADEGHIAGRHAVATREERLARRTKMAITFAEPNIGTVGAGYADLDRETTLIGEVDFARQGRARVMAVNHGVMRLYADKRDGRFLGAEFCAPAGEHMAHLLGLAATQKLRICEMLAMPFYHPVLEEGLRSALRDLDRQLPDEGRSDLAQCPALGIEALE